ncbi:MAG TPA: hypothetical protein VF655_03980 [Allosphingosinicella sp.]|jgi:phosphatidylglycerophosphate synthase
MSRPEFDEFAALWQDGPDPLDQAEMDAYARKASRRGQLLDYIDYAVWISLIVMLVGGAVISHSPLTLALAVPLMLASTWLTLRRRRLRQMARTLDTSDRAAFVETSLRNAAANLRRNTIGLLLIPLVMPMALIFKVSIRSGGGPQEVWHAFLLWAQSPRAVVGITLLSALAVLTLRSRRKTKAEILRLQGLREAYRTETDWERGK